MTQNKEKAIAPREDRIYNDQHNIQKAQLLTKERTHRNGYLGGKSSSLDQRCSERTGNDLKKYGSVKATEKDTRSIKVGINAHTTTNTKRQSCTSNDSLSKESAREAEAKIDGKKKGHRARGCRGRGSRRNRSIQRAAEKALEAVSSSAPARSAILVQSTYIPTHQNCGVPLHSWRERSPHLKKELSEDSLSTTDDLVYYQQLNKKSGHTDQEHDEKFYSINGSPKRTSMLRANERTQESCSNGKLRNMVNRELSGKNFQSAIAVTSSSSSFSDNADEDERSTAKLVASHSERSNLSGVRRKSSSHTTSSSDYYVDKSRPANIPAVERVTYTAELKAQVKHGLVTDPMLGNSATHHPRSAQSIFFSLEKDYVPDFYFASTSKLPLLQHYSPSQSRDSQPRTAKYTFSAPSNGMLYGGTGLMFSEQSTTNDFPTLLLVNPPSVGRVARVGKEYENDEILPPMPMYFAVDKTPVRKNTHRRNLSGQTKQGAHGKTLQESQHRDLDVSTSAKFEQNNLSTSTTGGGHRRTKSTGNERIRKQRESSGGSLFQTSPRSFLMGRRKKRRTIEGREFDEILGVLQNDDEKLVDYHELSPKVYHWF